MATYGHLVVCNTSIVAKYDESFASKVLVSDTLVTIHVNLMQIYTCTKLCIYTLVLNSVSRYCYSFNFCIIIIDYNYNYIKLHSSAAQLLNHVCIISLFYIQHHHYLLSTQWTQLLELIMSLQL